MQNKFSPVLLTSVLTGTIICLVTVGLLGQQFELSIFGGSGKLPVCGAVNLTESGKILKRGSLLTSSPDGFAKYQMCDGTMVYLDKNTQLRLDAYRNASAGTETQLTLIQGRVIIDGLADVHARNSVVATRGAGCEIVHYSWLDQIDITPFAEMACTLSSSNAAPPFIQTTRVSTFDDHLIDITAFEPAMSAAQPFYAWTGLNFENLK